MFWKIVVHSAMCQISKLKLIPFEEEELFHFPYISSYKTKNLSGRPLFRPRGIIWTIFVKGLKTIKVPNILTPGLVTLERFVLGFPYRFYKQQVTHVYPVLTPGA